MLGSRVNINLPKDLVGKARAHNLNISKVAEVALIFEINQLDNPDSIKGGGGTCLKNLQL
jgi:post-segregation antitoxin (ccd killing protein)